MDMTMARISGEAAAVTEEEEAEDMAVAVAVAAVVEVEVAAVTAARAMVEDIAMAEDTAEAAGGVEEDGVHDATVDELLMSMVLKVLLCCCRLIRRCSNPSFETCSKQTLGSLRTGTWKCGAVNRTIRVVSSATVTEGKVDMQTGRGLLEFHGQGFRHQASSTLDCCPSSTNSIDLRPLVQIRIPQRRQN